jgi:hypothetical protein
MPRQNMVLWVGSKSRPGNRTAPQKMTATRRQGGAGRRIEAVAISQFFDPFDSDPGRIAAAHLASSAAPLAPAARTARLPSRQAPFFTDRRFVVLLRCSIVFSLAGKNRPEIRKTVLCSAVNSGGGGAAR